MQGGGRRFDPVILHWFRCPKPLMRGHAHPFRQGPGRKEASRRVRWVMVTTPLDEAELLAQVRTGSQDAAGQLVAVHWPAAWKVACAVCRDHALTEDVAQEALIKALATVDRFDRNEAHSGNR